jgi:hypothetical protein
VFVLRNIVSFAHGDFYVFFGYTTEDIEFQRNKVLNVLFKTVSDGNNSTLFDMGGVLSLEECL